jgi:RimJ/RimL family protein N-acetyltransferase
MEDLGGPLSREDSDAKFDRYVAAYQSHHYGRWLVETISGMFLGYCGVMPARDDHPIGVHDEIGWRLVHSAWGNGYATEAARASLTDVFRRVGLKEVLAYTAPDNLRSQSVMRRLGLRRDTLRDFAVRDSRLGTWQGFVWAAEFDWLTSAETISKPVSGDSKDGAA